MAKYIKGTLDTVEYTPSGAAIAVDDVVILGTTNAKKSTVGVAMKNVADGVTAEGAVAVKGVFEFPKVSAAVIKAGESVSWDASSGAVDDNALVTAVGDVAEFGKAMEDGANGDTTIMVDIGYPGTYDGA